MFETHREFEIHLPKIFGDDRNQVWEYVFTRLHTPWLQVTCLPSDKEVDQFSKILHIPDIIGLLALQRDASATISEAYYVSPSHINGSENWKMDLLDHVMIADEPYECIEQHAYIYVLKNEQRLVDSNLNTKENELKNVQLLLQI